MIELTPKQKAFKELLENLYKKQEAIRMEILLLMAYHEKEGHVIVPMDPDIEGKLKTSKWASTWAYCAVCGKDFGWWCPKSPDHLCHYEVGIYGCKYCGMLEERK